LAPADEPSLVHTQYRASHKPFIYDYAEYIPAGIGDLSDGVVGAIVVVLGRYLGCIWVSFF
jgi:hypothetical protein